MASPSATAKNATEKTTEAAPSGTPSGKSGASISKEVDAVRGIARQGPMER